MDALKLLCEREEKKADEEAKAKRNEDRLLKKKIKEAELERMRVERDDKKKMKQKKMCKSKATKEI